MDTVLHNAEAIALHLADADIQHRRILQLLADLEAAHEHHKPAARVAEALERLTEYVQLHCADEEQFLEEHGFPSELLEPHLAEHRIMHEYLENACLRFRSEGAGSPDCLIQTLRTWFDTHSATADQVYLDHYRRQAPI